jgi:hypothetical protein
MSSLSFRPLRFRCADSARDILDHELCLSALSKNLEGELRLLHHERETCDKLDCVTLKTESYLVLEVKGNEPCDSRPGALLDGVIRVKDLAQAHEDGDVNRRGFHGGEFRWQGQGGLLAVGTLSGMTNAGILRDPVFEPACERCDEHGVMTGRLCGVIRRSRENPRLVGCQVFGVYRLRFDPTEEGGSGVRGTFEGVVVCECPE